MNKESICCRTIGLMRRAGVVMSAVLLALALPVISTAMNATPGGPLPQPLPLFPDDNWWNLDISAWPVDPASANYISFINNGGTRHLHPDLGGNAPTSQRPYASYGMPYAVVTGVLSTDLVPVEFYYADESDGVDLSGASFPFYPIPAAAKTQPYWIEGGDPGNVDLRSSQDRHLIIVDADRNYLYELYNVFYSTSASKWYAGSGAFFDMNTNNRRPEGWTSADAAGLAILPGLIRYDEVYDLTVGAEIQHALRVTVRATDGYVYPASHRAGSTAGALPMGARLRLKASVDITQRTSNANMQRIFRAMKKYGLIVADNGSDMYITGTYDTRWNNDIINPAFYSLTASDFEIVKLGYNPPVGPAQLSGLSVSPASVTGGQSATGTVTLTGPAPAEGLIVTLTASAASVPASVLVVAGATSASFTITTAPVASVTQAIITASHNLIVRQATLQVNPPVAPQLTALSLNPSTVNGGGSSTGTVSLSAPAGSGGVIVNLSSSKTSVATTPASVTVAAGQTSATFGIGTSTVKANTSVLITASSGGVSRTATLTVRKAKR